MWCEGIWEKPPVQHLLKAGFLPLVSPPLACGGDYGGKHAAKPLNSLLRPRY